MKIKFINSLNYQSNLFFKRQ